MRHTLFLLSSTLLATVPLTPALAQQAEAEEPAVGVTDIVVTAQKREENLQDTPISMIALGSDALEQKGVGSLSDLFTGSVPSLRIIPFVGRASAVSIGMRGMVPVDATQVTRDPTVGIYLDGVYLGRVQGLGMELADIERVEVLRGPQGTLFGRNTIGGAVSIVSKRPTGELGVDFKAGIANRRGRTFAAHINLPEAASLSFKIDAVYDARNGWVRNPLTRNDVPANYTIGGRPYAFEQINHDFHEVKRYGFRISALFKPTDTVSILYAYDWSRDASTGGYWHINATTQPIYPPLFGSLNVGRASVSRLAAPVLPSTATTRGHSITADVELSDNLTLRSITGARRLNSTQWDQDAGGISRYNTTAQGRLSYANVRQRQFSEELQLIGDVGDLKFVIGAYYFREHGEDTATVFRSVTFNVASSATSSILRNPATTSNTVGGVPNQLQDRAAMARITSKALFAQATWSPAALDNRLHVTAGGRYTDDHKDGRLTFLLGAPAAANLTFVFNSSRFDPMAIIAFDFSDDINTYIKYGRAYRAGGANTRSAILRSFGEEELISWEVGMKADLFDRRARFNIAAYRSRLSNAQVDFVNPANVSATETLNTPGATKVNGVEIDLTVVPTRGLTLGVNYVYTHFGQRAVTNPFSNLVELLNISNTPTHAYSVTLDYDAGRTGIGTPRLHLDADRAGGYFAAGAPSGDPSRNARTWLINGRLSLSEIPLFGDGLELALWAKNLTSRTYQQFDSIIPTGNGNNFISFYNEPRTYGVEMRLKF